MSDLNPYRLRNQSGSLVAVGGMFSSIRRNRLAIRALIVLTGLMTLLCGIASAEDVKTSDPNEVMAAFIRNFARYVDWPTNTFADNHSPWNIGILGDDSFGAVVEKSLTGRVEHERPFKVFHADKLDRLPRCQIVFIAYKDSAKRRAALNALKNLPTLTVADAPDFLREGGMIRFQVKDRVEMSINLDQARAVSLNIPAKMLEVSRQVLENGETRTLR
ncbi:MAG TPA: YfiR family protein [Candidatus Paceibacterota bacterium]|nr:YfiR family protein [Candidatus Paceibacterota bacterium]